MSAALSNKLIFAYSALRSLCDLCDFAVKIKPQLLILGLSFILLSSCTTKPTETPAPKPKKEETRLVGRIASIHKSQNFVLIQSYGPWNIQTGAILATNGPDGRAANLKVTGEKTGQFAAADIQSGTLEIGDSVYTTLKYEEIDTQEEPEKTPDPETPDTKEEHPESGTHDSSPPSIE